MKIAMPPPPPGRPGRRSGSPGSPPSGKNAATPAGPAQSQSTLFDGDTGPDFHVLPFIVHFDHRERAGGWRFGGMQGGASEQYRPLLVPTRETHMTTGDYSVDGVPVIVERKSHDDCIGSIGGGHVNFRKEHERMKTLVDAGHYCCVIVESSLAAICDELESPISGRRLTSAAVLSVVASWPQVYSVDWFFAGDRRRAEELALRILWKAWKRKESDSERTVAGN